MNTLVIHPKDRSTAFLKRIYEDMDDATIVTGGVSKTTLRQMVEDHDRVIMLGHGSLYGLMSVGQFPHAGPDIVDDSFRSALSKKDDSIFVWCHADDFVRRNGLKGFYTGMFISELSEAAIYRIKATYDDIDESNEWFAETMNAAAWSPRTVDLYHNVTRHYGDLALHNPVAQYNHERLYHAA